MTRAGGSSPGSRRPSTAPLADSRFGSTVTAGFDTGFDGGFIAGHGQTSGPGGISAAYLVRSDDVASVGIGFRPAVNRVAVEFRGLSGSADGTFAPGDPTLGNLALNLGGGPSTGAMLDDRVFGATDTAATEPGRLSATVGAVNGRANATPDAFVGRMATAAYVGDGGIFPEAVDRQPDYLRWGWWRGEQRHPAGDAEFPDRRDQFHLGTWVAGVVSDAAAAAALDHRPVYDGFAVANVVADGPAGCAAYVEGGSFRLDYDFAARSDPAAVMRRGPWRGAIAASGRNQPRVAPAPHAIDAGEVVGRRRRVGSRHRKGGTIRSHERIPARRQSDPTPLLRGVKLGRLRMALRTAPNRFRPHSHRDHDIKVTVQFA